MTKHPKNRAERLKLRAKKNKKNEDGATHIKRRAKNEIREKEAEHEVALAVNNS